MITRKLFFIVFFLLYSLGNYAQTSVIFSEGFNNSVSLFSVDTPSAIWSYYNSPTSEGFHSFGTTSSNGNTTNTITSNSINLSNFANCSLSFRVAGDNLDNNDNVVVSISENGGTFTTIATLNGRASGSNNSWDYTATGILNTAYPSPVTQNSGNTTNGTSTIIISNLPNISNLRIKIAVTKNSTNEAWYIDDFKIYYPTPSNVSIAAAVSPISSGSCDQNYVSMSANGGEIENINIYNENFSSQSNWGYLGNSQVQAQWSNSNNAGGSAPELSLVRVNNTNNTSTYSLVPYNFSLNQYISLNTNAYTSLEFSFRHRFNIRNGTFSRSIALQVSTDNTNFTNVWQINNINSNISPTLVSVNLNSYVNQSNLYFRFSYIGDSMGLTNWHIDDIDIIAKKNAVVSWAPTTNLYTDSTLTTPYTSGANVRTVYAKADSGETSYTVNTAGTPNKTASYTAFPNSKVFTGALNNDWANSTNWSPVGIPDISKCIKIPNGKTANVNTIGTIKTNAFAEYVRVFSGGALNIQSGNSLTIQNALKNENPTAAPKVILESDANLVQNSSAINTGDIIVKRKAKMKRLDYTYWSAPVMGQNLKSFSSATLDSRFYVYNESNDYFDGVFAYSTYPGFTASNAFPLQNKATYLFQTAKGYAVRAPNNYSTSLTTQDWTFTGVPNNGTQTINITKNGNGFNLIGNPYPSNLSFKSFYAANSSIINNKAYFWTNTNVNPPAQQGSSYNGNNYATLTSFGGAPAFNSSIIPTDSIAVGQGFIIEKTNAGTSSVTFNNTMRTITNGVFFNSRIAPPNPNPKYWLKLTTPVKNFNTLLVGYVPGATNKIDASFDAEPISMASDMFYSIQDQKNLIIQGRSSNFSIKDKVQLGAVFYETGNYEIAIAKLEGIFENSQPIYLKDQLLNKMVNLNEGPYTFYAEAGVDNNRFEIVYKPDSTLSAEAFTKTGLQVYPTEGWMVIESPESLSRVWVTDALGKQLYQSEVNGKTTRIQASHYPSGMYYITVETADGNKQSQKVLKK